MPYTKTDWNVGDVITEALIDKIEQGIADAHSGDIDDDAITTAKIAANAITKALIASGAVDTTQLAANAVATGKVAAEAITPAKTSFFKSFSSSGQIFAGQVDDDGTGLHLPSGWSSQRSGTGRMTIEHNFGHADYAAIASPNTPLVPRAFAQTRIYNNTFDIFTTEDDGTSVDYNSTFIVAVF